MHSRNDTIEFELRDYLRVLRRRKVIITLAVVVVVAAALAASYAQTRVYRASAQILLQQPSSSFLFNPNTGQPNDSTRAVATQIQVITSRPVQDAVRAKLGAAPAITANGVGQTDVISINAESTIPDQAAKIANAYAGAYIQFRRSQVVDDQLAAAQQIQNKIDDIQHQIDALDLQVASASNFQRAAVVAGVGPQRDALISEQAVFKGKLNETQVSTALSSGGAQLITPAQTPVAPIKPRPKRNAAIALAVGLIFGVGLAFLFEYLDDSIKTKEDLDRAVHGHLPTLGLIPNVGSRREKTKPAVVSLLDPKATPSEAYRTLRTSIQFLGLDKPLRLLQVTSAASAEGKTTTVTNLGVALASAGQRVMMCCCDLRRPRIHEFFGLSNSVGFTSVLLGQAELSEATQKVPGTDNLYLLASGPPPPNPSELLSSPRTSEVLTALQAACDIVLLDCPPVLPVTDAGVLAGQVDATLVVVSAGATTRRDLGRAIELLQQIEAPVVGLVLNGVSDQGGYGYGYNRYYAAPEPKSNGSSKHRARR